MKHVLSLLIAFFCVVTLNAQEKSDEVAPNKSEKEQPAQKSDSEKEKKIKANSKGPKAKLPYRFMANVHGGIGLMNYFGDLRDNPGTTVHRIGSHPGYNFGIGANVTNYLEVNVNCFTVIFFTLTVIIIKL